MNKTISTLLILIALSFQGFSDIESISPNVSLIHGAVNGVLLEQNGKTLAVYGDPRENPPVPEKVLFTHCRRDVVWAGQSLAKKGAEAVIPAGERESFMESNAYWQNQFTARYHDYAQQTTKFPVDSLQTATAVKEGDTIAWQGLNIQVLDTPGYTRNAISYLFEIDGQRIACVGDLIYGDGKLLDIYSLQDAIPNSNAGGYHGYMARAAEVIASLNRIASASPDVLLPARGPAIRHPQKAIATLISRIRAVYRNYLSINALRWYWGDEHIRACAARILGTTDMEWMPMAETVLPTPPEWMIPIGTSRLILSENGSGFLLDCGDPGTIQQILKLQNEKRVKNIVGIYITHYHDDHTNQIQQGSELFQCPLYFSEGQADILIHPDRYRMPAQPDRPALNFTIMKEGETLEWNEYRMTFSYFPGQTIYHGGLIVEKKGKEKIFFIGDSFTPSGLDDYCALNRNFLHPGIGYFYCLNLLKKMKPDYYLVNEHVIEPFRFSQEQLDFMIETLQKRYELFQDLFPWDDIHYGLDEQWARFYPYGIEAVPGQRQPMGVVIFNHSAQEQTFLVTPHAPLGWEIAKESMSVTIPAHQERTVLLEITPPHDAEGVSVITADISFGGWELREWTEGLVRNGKQ